MATTTSHAMLRRWQQRQHFVSPNSDDNKTTAVTTILLPAQ
jgi:hypothetical protein